MVPAGKGQKGGLPLALSRLLGSGPGMVPSTVTFGAITLRVGSSSFSTRGNQDMGHWVPEEAQQDFKPSTHLPPAHPPPPAESQQVFREPLGDHLSNSGAGSPSLPPRGPIQTSLSTP